MSFLALAQTLVRWMLAILFLGAGISHFTSMQRFFRAIVPKGLPNPNGIVALTGVMELLAGIGLIIPVTAPWTGIALILFLIAVFPANIEAARQHLPYSNPLWVRAAAQVVLIGLVAWAR